jgi:hypothetical protein
LVTNQVKVSHGGGAGGALFDMLSDFYRGMQGVMTDTYPCPHKLLAACEKILKRRRPSQGFHSPASGRRGQNMQTN